MEIKYDDICFVIAVNDDTILNDNFLLSKDVNNCEIFIQREYSSAAKAYNEIIHKTHCNYIVFAHQDVYFPENWIDKLISNISDLKLDKVAWGVLGVVGVNDDQKLVGHLWSQGINREINEGNIIETVTSVDEVVIVLRRDSGLLFDESLRGYHLYGTDIVMQSKELLLQNFVFDMPIIHNDKRKFILDFNYYQGYRYIAKKWKKYLPIHTTVMPVNTYGIEFFYRNLRQLKNIFFPPVLVTLDQPVTKAKELGYE